MTKTEKRGGLLGVEARADDATGKRTLIGYAAVFNSPTVIGGDFREQIAPGAFARAVKDDVRALVDHNHGRVVGRTKSGTLRMSEDSHGLKVEIDVPNTSDGNDLWELVGRGDISGMSFSFRTKDDHWEAGNGDELPLRTLIDLDVPEVSAVAWPAYDDTEIGKRSLEEWRSAHPGEPAVDEPAPPVSRAAPNTLARLSKSLDLKVRTTR